MKKKVLTTLIIGIAAIGVTAAVVPATVAWFNKKTEIDGLSINGGAEGAYFAGGDGSSEHPYLITKPIHVYNLAWLQYLGTFNKTTSGTTIDQQFYFKVENDIDMGGLVIPPIGTEQYPFVGNFDGDNHTIGNFKTTNDYSSLVKKPYSVTKLENVDIVGFFGLVGKKQDSSLVYSSEENEVKNFGLYDFCIESSAQNTLVGMAAGYVNGVLSGVGVNKGLLDFKQTATPITSITGNLSEYSTIGYCTDKYISQCEIRDTDYYEPSIAFDSTSHGGTEWGASIPMKDIYNDLLDIYSNRARRDTVYTTETRNYDIDGNLIGEPILSNPQNVTINSNNGNPSINGSSQRHYLSYERAGSDGAQTASYCFYNSGNGNQYMYLYGHKKYNISGGKTIISNGYTTSAGKKIKDSSGNYVKVTFNGDTPVISNTTAVGEASSFYIDTDGTYQIVNNNTTYYLSIQQDENMYLNLVTDKDLALPLVSDGTSIHLTNPSNYYIGYNNGHWKLTIVETTDYGYLYNKSGTTRYVTLTTSGAGSTTSKASATHLYMDDSNRIYFETGGTKYYYSIKQTVSGSFIYRVSYQMSSAASLNEDNNTPVTMSGDILSASVKTGGLISPGTGTGYVFLDGSTYGATTTQSNATSFEFEKDVIGEIPEVTTVNGDAIYRPSQSTTTASAEYETNPTYFPLLWNDDKTEPADRNTGYIVSGTSNNHEGDIRVSAYNKSSLSASTGSSTSGAYTDSSLHVVTRTAGSNGYVVIKDSINKNTNYSGSSYNTLRRSFATTKTVEELGLVKYTSSRANLGTTLTDRSTNYVYGLHFMDASISPTRTVSVPHAKINGVNKYNYQLPEDCVDFNLKAKGYINFFGGTYFTYPSDNDTFFSLHEIQREGTLISSIKQISQIYLRTGVNPQTNSAPYFYKYSNGTFSSNYNSSVDSATTDNLVFDMSWVTNPTMVINAVYYFEIPVNSGEFALGSVSGKQGAYLMYLDIGAAAMTDDSYIITHKLSSQVKSYNFPKGVDFNENVAITSSSTHDYTNIQGGDVATVTVPTNVQGEISYELDDDILSCGPPSGVTLTSKFCASNITIKANGVEIGSDGGLVYQEVTIQTETINFNTGTGTLSEILEVEHYFYDSEGVEQTDKYYKETIRSSITEGVETNPYNYTAMDGLVNVLTKTYFVADDVPDLFIDVTYDQLNNAYYITFYASAAGNMKVTLGDTLSGLTVYITNYSETEAVEAGETYEITAELREAN